MRSPLLLSLTAGVLLASGTAVWVMACDKEAKSTAAASATTSKSAMCNAAMASRCTPAQAAACKANMKGASAVTADANAGRYPDAVTAVQEVSTCPHGAKAITASGGSCAGHGVSATAAVYGSDKMMAMPAGAGHSCGTKGATASNAGNGYSCGGRGMTTASGRYLHANCDACADMNNCEGELKSAGATTQVVKLKNGVMYVYTAHDAAQVRAVQAAVAQRNDRIAAINVSGEKAKLCPDCKVMRGAMASGKLSREMVPIEGGCLTLVTSSDPSIVIKLHAMLANHENHAKI